MRYNGAAVDAIVEKKDNTKRPAMKPPRVGDVAVMMVPRQTPKQPTKIADRRPFQSESQMKGAAAICPTYRSIHVVSGDLQIGDAEWA